MDLDYLKASDETGEAVLAHVTADRDIGATTLEVDDVENWPDYFIGVTGDLAANGYIDASSMVQFKGHLNGGNIEIDEFLPGYADAGNTEDQVVIIKQNTTWTNEVVNRLRKIAQEGFADFVASGLVASQDSGLDLDIATGIIWVNGYRLSIDAVNAETLNANSDTYVDVGSDGVVDFNDVANNDPAPALAADHARIAKVVTDGSGITDIVQEGVDSNGVSIYNITPVANGAITSAKLAVVENSSQTDAGVSCDTSYTTIETLALDIPADWNSWDCFVTTSFTATTTDTTVRQVTVQISIDGTGQQEPTFQLVNAREFHFSRQARRTGITSTGSVTILVKGKQGANAFSASKRFLYARAIRTS